MAATTAPTRYTINRDGTLEKWYLEHDGGETVYLRKTPRPKWNCGMKEFPAAEVYESVQIVRTYEDGTTETPLSETYTGTDRRKAFARFAALQKERPGIETIQDTDRRAWEH